MYVNIARMKRSELPEVMELERESFSWPWSEGMFLGELDRDFSHILLARDGAGALLGYICLWALLGEAHILNIAVRKDNRRTGIGSDLAAEALTLARGQGAVAATLEVRERNVPAIRFYERLGFVRAGLRKGYYDSPKDNAVIMWLYDIAGTVKKSP